MQNNSSERQESFVLHCLINYLESILVHKATIKKKKLNIKENNVKTKIYLFRKCKVLQCIWMVNFILLLWKIKKSDENAKVFEHKT